MHDDEAASSSRWLRRARYAAGLAVGLAGCAVVLPRLTGADWTEVLLTLLSLPVVSLAGLAGLWLAGLAAHTVTLSAALPRLGHRRALTLSLTGSAVANLLPLGGVAGVAMNYRMTRSWGFERQSFVVYTLVTNLWDVLARLVLPCVAVVWMVVAGLSVGTVLHTASVVAAVGCAVVLVLAAALALPRTAGLTARAVERTLRWVVRWLPARWRPAVPGTGRRLLNLRSEVADVVRSQWPRLTLGVVVYAMLAASLLAACLRLTHAGVPLAGVAAGFALERVLGLIGVTPGGSGIIEVGLTGLLLAAGGDPVGTLAGVLLFRAFSLGLETAVGGLGLLGWLAAHRLSPSRVAVR